MPVNSLRSPGGAAAILSLWTVAVGGWLLPARMATSQTPPPGQPATPTTPEAAPMPENPFPRRVKAPGLDGGVAWINTAGPLELEKLRGKFVLLDFWTYCCINCMHILPELKKLEAKYPNQLVVIGVHSAKFLTEEDSQNITDAVLRYEIAHPVINDAQHTVWNRFSITSWPSLRVIDPEGYLVAGHSGEIAFEDLDAFFRTAIPYYRQKGTLDEKPIRFDVAADKAQDTPLRYPGKVLADEASGRLFIADSNHNRIIVTSLDGSWQATIGSGRIGTSDGAFAAAAFNHPQGMALRGDTLYVCDTENHLLRKVDLKQQRVTTIAGLGFQSRSAWPGLEREAAAPERFVGPPRQTALNSPWDLWIRGDDLYIAMAGPHQIWKMPLDESEIGPYAGNGREDIVDGPLLPRSPYAMGWSSFAQPSGLASDGEWLFVADSEGSSVRAVPFDASKDVKTIIGTAHLESGRLFDFGDIDGAGLTPRLQHPLGVVFHEGALYVADTYNNKIKVIDPAKGTCKTLVGNGKPGAGDDPALFDEPAGISAARGKLYVADTNNHAIRTIDLHDGQRVSTLVIRGLAAPVAAPAPVAAAEPPGTKQVDLPATEVQAVEGAIRFRVKLVLPDGFKVAAAAPLRFTVSAEIEAGPVDRQAIGKAVKVDPPSAEFDVAVPVATQEGQDQVKIAVDYFICRTDESLCKPGRVVWHAPVRLAAKGSTQVPLEFRVE